MSDLSPQQILQYATGAWATAILDAGIRHDVFGHIERGRTSSGSIAEAASISPRGAQALVDGLVGLKLLTVKDGAYANSPESAEFLVKGKQKFIGGFVSVHHEMAADWLGYAEIADRRIAKAHRAGEGERVLGDARLGHWHALPAVPVAHKALALLGWANLPSPSGLDIGEVLEHLSAIRLREHPGARSDEGSPNWANVNAVTRGFIAHAGRRSLRRDRRRPPRRSHPREHLRRGRGLQHSPHGATRREPRAGSGRC
ncbi:MAG: methyltransferase dimerization domain-containing protein [Acidobacteriota bacterium]